MGTWDRGVCWRWSLGSAHRYSMDPLHLSWPRAACLLLQLPLQTGEELGTHGFIGCFPDSGRSVVQCGIAVTGRTLQLMEDGAETRSVPLYPLHAGSGCWKEELPMGSCHSNPFCHAALQGRCLVPAPEHHNPAGGLWAGSSPQPQFLPDHRALLSLGRFTVRGSASQVRKAMPGPYPEGRKLCRSILGSRGTHVTLTPIAQLRGSGLRAFPATEGWLSHS